MELTALEKGRDDPMRINEKDHEWLKQECDLLRRSDLTLKTSLSDTQSELWQTQSELQQTKKTLAAANRNIDELSAEDETTKSQLRQRKG